MKKTLIISALALLSFNAYAKDVWFDVDFDRVDWETLCPNVKPVELAGCKVVHPASARFRISDGFVDSTVNCEQEAKSYARYINSSLYSCKANFRAFYTGIMSDKISLEKGKRAVSNYRGVDVEAWRDKYLGQGVVDK